MIRKIIKINREKCNGCGACARACHEGAIEIVDGKAVLTAENYCDGLGDCLPACPADAISFDEREAPAYDEEAVIASKAKRKAAAFSDKDNNRSGTECHVTGKLSQWPVQIKLVPIKADWFDRANLLVSADCCAYAYGNFHNDFIDGKITIIGCPKLDMIDYTEKLAQIIASNDIRSITVTRMEVPCCGGLENAVKRALLASGKIIPWKIVTISNDGRILNG